MATLETARHWAGKLDVEEGPVPLPRLHYRVGDNKISLFADESAATANRVLRPETRSPSDTRKLKKDLKPKKKK
jgi:hypothetical protein